MEHVPRDCSRFHSALAVLGKPWSVLLLTVLQEKPLRYRALAERIPALGDRMLSVRLKELEERGLVERRVLPGRPPGVEYALTAGGRAFRHVIEAIEVWAHALSSPARSIAATRRRAAR